MSDALTQALTDALRQAAKEMGQKVTVDTGATNINMAGWITNAGMFSPCGPGQLLSTMVVDQALSQWLGALPTDQRVTQVKILGYVGPEGTAANNPDWERDSTCAAPPGVEYGKCELEFCLGELARSGGDLSLLELGLAGCSNAPRYYITGPNAGMPIQNERDAQLAMAGMVMVQMFERMNVVGNRNTSQLNWDGLQVLINTPVIDYRAQLECQDAEPVIYDWNSGAISSNICEVITAIVRRIRERGQFLGGVSRQDMILLMTPLMRDALIDFAGCGCGPCSGQTNEILSTNPFEARRERARLATGGTYGMGMFEVDGVPVDILTSGWIPQTSTAPNFCSDIYVLSRRVGADRILYNEYQDFTRTLAGVPANLVVQGARVTDNGKFLVLSQNVHECFNEEVFMKARLVLRAPWLQARITDVCAPFTLAPITPIPGDTHFWAGYPPTNYAHSDIPYEHEGCESW